MKQEKNEESYSGIYACDFETTVDEDTASQEETEVWSACYVELAGNKKPVITSTIDEMFDSITSHYSKGDEITLYFHNLKFDGTFIITKLLQQGRQFVEKNFTAQNGESYLINSRLKSNEYNCVISDMGAFYKIIFKWKGVVIVVKDSLKLIPMSLKSAGKGFNTQHQKTEMNYTGKKSITELSEKDKEYIENDVLVLKELLVIMFDEGHEGLTIGSCCMSEFKKGYSEERYNFLFPDLTKIIIPEIGISQDEYVRKSYKGGWCYVAKRVAGQELYNGEVYDANSHYPSQMISKENQFPVSKGWYRKAIDNRFDDQTERRMKKKDFYYFIRFRCQFSLKDGYYPFIQIKGNPNYDGSEMLESSSQLKSGKKIKSYIIDDTQYTSDVEMTMTKTDWELFNKSYKIENLEIYDLLMYYTESGYDLFHEYIEKYMKMKVEAVEKHNPAMKAESKLFLNNLYGKFGTNPLNCFKIPYLENGVLKYHLMRGKDKKAGYVAIGAAITSYARCITVGIANSNYDNFAYSDTDSVHMYNCENFSIKGIEIHPSAFGAWKNESKWDKAKFVRAKTYMERIIWTDKDGSQNPEWEVKAAGMGDKGKEELSEMVSLKGTGCFESGLELSGGLKAKAVKGGTLLVEKRFTLK